MYFAATLFTHAPEDCRKDCAANMGNYGAGNFTPMLSFRGVI